MGGWRGVRNLPPEGLRYLAGTNSPASSQLSFPDPLGLELVGFAFLRSTNFFVWKSFLTLVKMRGIQGYRCLKTSLDNWSIMVKLVSGAGNATGFPLSLENWQLYTFFLFFFSFHQCLNHVSFFLFPCWKEETFFGYINISKVDVLGTVLWHCNQLAQESCVHNIGLSCPGWLHPDLLGMVPSSG